MWGCLLAALVSRLLIYFSAVLGGEKVSEASRGLGKSQRSIPVLTDPGSAGHTASLLEGVTGMHGGPVGGLGDSMGKP